MTSKLSDKQMIAARSFVILAAEVFHYGKRSWKEEDEDERANSENEWQTFSLQIAPQQEALHQRRA